MSDDGHSYTWVRARRWIANKLGWTEEMEARASNYGSTADGSIVSSASKVEPKVWLAAERTYLNWLRVGVLLATFGLALLNGAATQDRVAKVLAFLYVALSLGMLAYAYNMQQLRKIMIATKYPGHFDDLVGPTVIIVSLFVIVVANFYFAYKYREGLNPGVKEARNPIDVAYTMVRTYVI